MIPFRQVHLDFHTSEAIPGIGEKFDKKQFQGALEMGHVDSITIFAKCHHGWSYYSSKINAIHPNLKFDLLKAELEACREIDVHAPVYLSAGFDERMAREHPEWLIRKPDETLSDTATFMEPGYHRMCYNTPYLDKLLAELREVMENYHPEGIFLDISAVTPCVCSRCRREILERGGDYRREEDVRAQAERTFATYVKKVRETVEEYDKDCRIFHNAGHIVRGRRDLAHANTHLELESLPTGGWGYDHFPMSASYVKTLGMEYLGMTGKFHTTWGEFGGYKHPNALRYEAGLSLAFGAKCSIGDQMHPNGRMNEKTYRLIGKAYEEVEQKEPWCRHAVPISDVAVLSQEAAGSSLATRETVHHGDVGANRVLLEGHYLYSFIDLEEEFGRYRVLILPDNIELDEALEHRLSEYLAGGGKLLLSGRSGLRAGTEEFALNIGARFEGGNPCQPTYCVFPNEGEAEVIYEKNYRISLTSGKALAEVQNPYFNRDILHFSSHQHAPNDEGKSETAVVKKENIIYIGWDIFAEYGKIGSLQAKRLILTALNELLDGSPTAEAKLPDKGILTMTKQEEEHRYIVHHLFAHTTVRGHFLLDGEEKPVEAIEDLVPLYNVEGTVRVPERIRRVYLAPSMEELEFVYREKENGSLANGAAAEVYYRIPKMECHQMVVMEY